LSYGQWHEKCGGAATFTEVNDDGGIRPSRLGRRPFIGGKTASTALPRSANKIKALCDTDDDKWAPRVSEFKIQNKPQIQFLAWEKYLGKDENLEKFVEVGNPIWSNFFY
jgi:hypothetical protein